MSEADLMEWARLWTGRYRWPGKGPDFAAFGRAILDLAADRDRYRGHLTGVVAAPPMPAEPVGVQVVEGCA